MAKSTFSHQIEEDEEGKTLKWPGSAPSPLPYAAGFVREGTTC